MITRQRRAGGGGRHRNALLRDLGEMRDLLTEMPESERLASGHAALHTEAVDLAALVRELVAAQWPDAGLTLQLNERLGPVHVDLMRVRLLLRNLLDNAQRHSAGATTPPVVSLSSDTEDSTANERPRLWPRRGRRTPAASG